MILRLLKGNKTTHGQRLKENFQISWKRQSVDLIDNDIDSATQRSILVVSATPSPESTTHSRMESISRYAGGGGTAQSAFIRVGRTIYQLMLRDPQKQQLKGFGQWENLNLLRVTLTGEAREVHSAFMDEWNYVDRSNPNYQWARRAERAQVSWRNYRPDQAAFLTLRR